VTAGAGSPSGPAAARRARLNRRAGREVAAVVLGGAGAGAAVWLLFLLASYRARPDLCVAAGLAAVAAWRLVRATAPPPPVPDAAARREEDPGDGFAELYSLEHRLSWGSVDRDRFCQRVRPLLVGLAVDRLRSRHGLDARTHPEQVRRIVGEPLWELMTGPPPSRCPTRPELARLVETLERI
jgi:hypothetical protein